MYKYEIKNTITEIEDSLILKSILGSLKGYYRLVFCLNVFGYWCGVK